MSRLLLTLKSSSAGAFSLQAASYGSYAIEQTNIGRSRFFASKNGKQKPEENTQRKQTVGSEKHQKIARNEWDLEKGWDQDGGGVGFGLRRDNDNSTEDDTNELEFEDDLYPSPLFQPVSSFPSIRAAKVARQQNIRVLKARLQHDAQERQRRRLARQREKQLLVEREEEEGIVQQGRGMSWRSNLEDQSKTHNEYTEGKRDRPLKQEEREPKSGQIQWDSSSSSSFDRKRDQRLAPSPSFGLKRPTEQAPTSSSTSFGLRNWKREAQ